MRHTDHDDRHCAHCAARTEADPRDRVAVRVGDLLPPDTDPWRAPEGDTGLDGAVVAVDQPTWQGRRP